MSAGYQRYNNRISIRENRPNFNEISDWFQQNIRNIFWIHLNICQILVDTGQRVKTWKIAGNIHVSTEANSRILRISTGYQGLLYTGYYELSPLGRVNSRVVLLLFQQKLAFQEILNAICIWGRLHELLCRTRNPFPLWVKVQFKKSSM